MRTHGLTYVLCLALAAACGDDDNPANPDAPITPDGPPGGDAPPLVCPDPAAAWDWPLPQGPVTVTPDPSWKHDVSASHSGGAGTVMRASYVCRIAGLSWVGTHDRVRIASPCENRYGCFLPAVWSGESHWSAGACGEVV